MNEFSWLLAGVGLGLLFGLGGGWLLLPRFSFTKARLDKKGWLSPEKMKSPNSLRPIKESLHGQALLVPVRHDLEYPTHAVQAGLELALHSGQPLHVVVFIEVPRILNLESGLDEELEKAFQMLEEVEKAGQKAGVTIVGNVTKVRNYILAVVETALEIRAGLIIAEQASSEFSLPKVSLVNQAEMIGNKTGCNFLLLNPSHLTDSVIPSQVR